MLQKLKWLELDHQLKCKRYSMEAQRISNMNISQSHEIDQNKEELLPVIEAPATNSVG